MAKYRLFLLQLTGFALIVSALITLGKLAMMGAGIGVILQYGMIGLVTFIIGISMASPRHMPRFLADPTRKTDPLLVVFVLVGVGFCIKRFAEWSAPLMPQDDFLKPMGFAGLVSIAAAILYLPILLPEMISGLSREERPEEMPKSKTPASADAASRASDKRSVFESLHLMFIRLAGLAAFVAAFWPIAAMNASSVEIGIATGMAVLAAVLLLMPRMTPNVVSRPIGFFSIFGFLLFAVLIFVLAMGPLALQTLPPAELTALGNLTATPEALVPALEAMANDPAKQPLVLAVAAVGGLLGLALLTSLVLIFQAPSLRTRKERFNPGASKLPALGWMMKLYVAVDWLTLRVLGAALLATAWLLWQMIQTDSIRTELLSYGLEPMQALILYAAAGAILAIPFVLPRFLATPRHVFFGMVKAVLLVGTGILLLPVLEVLIRSYSPAVYHPVLLEAAPRLLKIVLGIAVTSAILVSFFRHLAGPTRTDYMGRPIMMMKDKDLRELRALRMG